MQTVVAALDVALAGQKVAPFSLSKQIAQHFKPVGLAGPLPMIASAIDVAAWDALAVAADMPLAELLGAERKPVPAYNSCGLGLVDGKAAADEAEELLEGGFRAVKMRLGRPDFSDDLAAVRLVRKRLPDHIALMVDFNQALTFAQAMQYCPALDDEGVYWIEEPILHDDYKHASLIAAVSKTPLQIGENCIGVRAVAKAIDTVASDYLMFDLDRIGGVSGWGVAAGLAAAYGREISSHLFPEVSAHVLAGTTTMHWLEYVDWAAPLLEDPMVIVDGMAIASERPGNGLRWNAEAVARYRLR
jgi:mandelate racemase